MTKTPQSNSGRPMKNLPLPACSNLRMCWPPCCTSLDHPETDVKSLEQRAGFRPAAGRRLRSQGRPLPH